VRQAARADFIIWVVSATQPARDRDRTGLNEVRSDAKARLEQRPAPIILALTHIDQLRPAAEWDPPYDVTTPASPKAHSIRAAINSVAGALDLQADAVVPIAMPAGRQSYNIDALWARIALDLDEAKLAQLDRIRVGQQKFRMRELMEQIGSAGRLIVKGMVVGSPNSDRVSHPD